MSEKNIIRQSGPYRLTETLPLPGSTASGYVVYSPNIADRRAFDDRAAALAYFKQVSGAT